MSNSQSESNPWGQQSFDADLRWEDSLANGLNQLHGMSLPDAQRLAGQLSTFDMFDTVMPTGRPKHDIGRYVLSNGIDVPVVDSMPEWQQIVRSGNGMLRSEHVGDYSGMSGLLRTQRIRLNEVYPKDENGVEAAEEWTQTIMEDGMVRQSLRRVIEGPPNLEPAFDAQRYARTSGEAARHRLDDARAVAALLDGSVDPADLMTEHFWRKEQDELLEEARDVRLVPPYIPLHEMHASRWRYVPGVNVRVFRDPVVEGKYYLGGRNAHHEWTVTDGRDSPDVEAHTKGGYRRGRTPQTFEYSLPTGRIIDLYETVRTLPYFDQTQAPVMEMQLGEDGKLYFLQYLKTGQVIDDPGEFPLPTSRGAVTASCVRGVTGPEGEKLRMYLDPGVFTRGMHDQAVQVAFNMTIGSSSGLLLQTAAMNSRVVLTDFGLNFKNNHSNSAPLFRPPVAIDMWDAIGEVAPLFTELNESQPEHFAGDYIDTVEYLDVTVTSNGRQAVIESDWRVKSQEV